MATRDHIYKASTVTSKTDESFSAQTPEEIAFEDQQYCSEGGSSKEKVASSGPTHVAFAPDSIARKAMPRRTQLRELHFLKYG